MFYCARFNELNKDKLQKLVSSILKSYSKKNDLLGEELKKYNQDEEYTKLINEPK